MLKNLNLYEKSGQYFLSAEYLYEDNKGKYRMLIPAISLYKRRISAYRILSWYHRLVTYKCQRSRIQSL